MSIKIKDNVNV